MQNARNVLEAAGRKINSLEIAELSLEELEGFVVALECLKQIVDAALRAGKEQADNARAQAEVDEAGAME